MWYISSGRRNRLAHIFRDDGFVAINFPELGNPIGARNKEELVERYRKTRPDMTEQQRLVAASQVWRWLTELKPGDEVAIYEPEERRYHVGVLEGTPFRKEDAPEGLKTRRKVQWKSFVSRDDLSHAAKGRLGAILTLFKVHHLAAAELRREPSFGGPNESELTLTDEVEAEAVSTDSFEEIESIALERVKDKIQALNWEDMQELVAALLRAIGFRTTVSPKGTDRGRDIVASKDGFGFEAPRIIVEVKHREGASGAPIVRGLKGAMGDHFERGLLVSTGGFSREARYEADRAPITLMGIDELAAAVLDNYERFDEFGRKLLPLMKIYWPA